MHSNHSRGFTVVELLIIVVIIAIIASVTVVSYSAVQNAALETSAQANLKAISSSMQSAQLRSGSFPTSLDESLLSNNPRITITLESSGTATQYQNLSEVQNGVLLSQICSDLITEGVGRAADQGGTQRDYITGCGNWNSNSMQVTGWDTRTWATPVQKTQLTDYADTFVVTDPYHKQAHESVVKNFYGQLVSRLEAQGGRYPVTSFWDYWAAPGNGGVVYTEPSGPTIERKFFCAQASIQSAGEPKEWHITEEDRLREGSC